ncbi:MAG: diguanylate cyclase [Ghiorsea sp.]
MRVNSITYCRYIFTLIIIIIISEYLVMILLNAANLDISLEAEAIADSLSLLIVAALPTYFFIVKPIVRTADNYHARLESLATLDGLTGIANRRTFDHALLLEWKRALRNQQSFSLIMVDIDCFKLFNDNYGHQQGDRCLKAVAKILGMVPRRPADVVARYGGEEFVILLPETDLAQATLLAEKCRKVITEKKLVFNGGINDVLTISLGVSSIVPNAESTSSELLEAADKALYRAKDQGRNQVVSA